MEAFQEHSTYSSSEFVKHVVKKFPYAIECIQTDNGAEFTNRLNSKGTKRQTLFEHTLAELGICHRLIRPYTPRHNGKVERSHRKDNEYFYASLKISKSNLPSGNANTTISPCVLCFGVLLKMYFFLS
ncbi:MAG: hypothetical protein LUC30_04440 [Clostridiales bacterium]|nr:hypothetical protein [Clostridiales bacterium]